MNSTRRTKWAIYAVAAVYSACLAVAGVSLPDGLAKVLAYIPAGVFVLFLLLDHLLWKLPVLRQVLGHPVILGTWHGTLMSYRREQSGKEISTSHEIFLTIEQSLVSLEITLHTAESKSKSSTAQILRLGQRDFAVQYQYQNTPQMKFRDNGSPIHIGGSSMEISGFCPKEIEAEYWTSRDTRGTYSLRLESRKRVSSFKEGQRMLKNQNGDD